MNKDLFKIVLTGGPCAGKTTALSRIEQFLMEQGFTVLIVSESATELIKGGIKPFGDSKVDLLFFQKLILKYQYEKEKVYEKAALNLLKTNKCVILYDRGLIDNKAYINQEKFDYLLKDMNLKELDLMDNYDMVIHLVTAADGKEEYYTLENNNARTETVLEAKILDSKTVNAWVGHRNLKIIDNETEFEEKMKRVINEINNLLGSPISLKKENKYLIDIEKSDLNFLNNDNMAKTKIEQYYIKSNNNYEKRLRKRTYKGQNTYYFTVQQKEVKGKSKIVTDKKITEKEFNKLLDLYPNYKMISKTRYSFVKNKQYFRLDIFGSNCLAILEVEPTIENKSLRIPNELFVIKEVTNDISYNNFNLAKSKIQKELNKHL